MIAAVLFDLYETLVTERDAKPVRASSLAERLGLDTATFKSAWKPRRLRVIRGEMTFADALLDVGDSLGCYITPELCQRLSDERRVGKGSVLHQFDPTAIAVLRRLRDDGFKLAVVSNCFAEDVTAWPQSPAFECFDVSVFSFEVGAAKPAPGIYLEATERLAVQGPDALFIGDGGDDELLGAERAGLRVAQATWFRGDLPGLPGHIPRLSSWPAVLDFATAG
jgi:putative hydrolase of the HAD superfamily